MAKKNRVTNPLMTTNTTLPLRLHSLLTPILWKEGKLHYMEAQPSTLANGQDSSLPSWWHPQDFLRLNPHIHLTAFPTPSSDCHSKLKGQNRIKGFDRIKVKGRVRQVISYLCLLTLIITSRILFHLSTTCPH